MTLQKEVGFEMQLETAAQTNKKPVYRDYLKLLATGNGEDLTFSEEEVSLTIQLSNNNKNKTKKENTVIKT